jgi:hypothetical protein
VLVDDELANMIEPRMKNAVAVVHNKRFAPTQRVKMCDCGRPATRRKQSSNICDRCDEIEHRLHSDFITEKKAYRCGVSGMSEHVLHLA